MYNLLFICIDSLPLRHPIRCHISTLIQCQFAIWGVSYDESELQWRDPYMADYLQHFQIWNHLICPSSQLSVL